MSTAADEIFRSTGAFRAQDRHLGFIKSGRCDKKKQHHDTWRLFYDIKYARCLGMLITNIGFAKKKNEKKNLNFF